MCICDWLCFPCTVHAQLKVSSCLGPKFDEEDLGEEDGDADEAADSEDVEDRLEVHHTQRTDLARVLRDDAFF
jgi:hypothetical protein